MKDRAYKNFLAQLTQFEKWVAEETFALKKRNFTYLNEVLINKRNTLDALITVKERAGFEKGSDSEIDQRIAAAIHQQSKNQRHIITLMEDTRTQQQLSQQESKKLKGVRGTYTSAIASGKRSQRNKRFEA